MTIYKKISLCLFLLLSSSSLLSMNNLNNTIDMTDNYNPRKLGPNEVQVDLKNSKISKSKIRKVQTQLKRRGLYKGDINGSIGKKTRDAIKELQSYYDIEVTGNLNKETLGKLDL